MLTSSGVMSITNDLALSPHDRRSASQPPRRESATSNATRTRPHTVSAETSHTYVTHLIEFGYPERFVTEQVGHSYASTTAIYTSVSNDFKTKTLQAALRRVYGSTTTTGSHDEH
jgi:integrase/recombinase XerC